ncbi:hypothetical protein ZYGR_0P03630 [Zygosaccharomyces rouxii]|uniref:ZYRO0E08866p n=2 Tax=Zygosaccharomyces rouxii TaxID=4956 RepID=C5E4U6_ZYGRC|nr:uncharacterized protein ZYRO0E08866g [Zygosaccharomyces rouxii]KAH9198087.1 DNA repair protein Nse5/Nse6 [Zygosaccharomyces rouxii]GAV49717.1 hypothetical protein ZYGR_0P03630 [Zygosaccharomyces rouxii]CAR31057.1 ZYRO0E08866p [Zygosaccharomyces rouxii]
MSSDSDEDAIIFRQNVNDNELDSSSSSSSSTDEDDRLLQTLKRTSYSSRRVTRSSPIKKSKSVQIQKFDLGRNFDPQLASSLDRIQNVKDEVDNPSTVTTVKEQKSNTVRSRIKPRDASSQYIDLIVRETISGRYIDWHFISNDTRFEDVDIDDELIEDSDNHAVRDAIRRKYPTLLELIESLGADLSLLQEDKPLTRKRDYDSLSEMTPVDSMMRAIGCYQDDKQFIKYLLCFILDRKIWESQDCDDDWCSQMLESVGDEQIIDFYLSLVDPKDYFMHYRLSRCISRLQSPLIHRIIRPITIEEEFTQLIEDKNYESLLYFTLFVYGSHEMPFGPSSRTQYFKDCVEDMCNEGTNAVELSLLRGLLSLFLKIRIS